MLSGSLEEIATNIARMQRDELLEILRSLRCSFKLDFTDEYLTTLSLERLRHVTMAAFIHADQIPAGR